MFWDEICMMCGVICFGQFGRRKYQQNRRRVTGLTTENSGKNWTEETIFRFLLRQPECATRQNITESSVLQQRQIDKTDDDGENRHIDQNGLERRQYKIDCYWLIPRVKEAHHARALASLVTSCSYATGWMLANRCIPSPCKNKNFIYINRTYPLMV